MGPTVLSRPTAVNVSSIKGPAFFTTLARLPAPAITFKILKHLCAETQSLLRNLKLGGGAAVSQGLGYLQAGVTHARILESATPTAVLFNRNQAARVGSRTSSTSSKRPPTINLWRNGGTLEDRSREAALTKLFPQTPRDL